MLTVGDVRPTVYALLEALTAWEIAQDGSGSMNADAMDLAVRGMPLEALDVSVAAGAHTVDVDVDFSILLGAALLTMKRLVGELAATTNCTEEEVISDLREFVAAFGA